jgi:hypothetical protein
MVNVLFTTNAYAFSPDEAVWTIRESLPIATTPGTDSAHFRRTPEPDERPQTAGRAGPTNT